MPRLHHWNDAMTTNSVDRPGVLLFARRYRSHLLSLVVVICVAIVWFILGITKADALASDDANEQEVKVAVLRVSAQTVPFEPRYVGRTEAYQTVQIRSRVRGFLQERLFQEGGAVEAGDVLFRIDPRPFEVGVEIARARVESAEARMVQAERQVNRYRGLHEQGAATASELEEWETALEVATADRELYKAQLVQAELDLGYTTITSPISGMIGRSLRDVGSFVDDGSNSLLAVVEQVDPLYVRFAVSESEILRYRRMRESGQLAGPRAEEMHVKLIQRDGTVYEHLGQITYVDVVVDDATSTLMMRATVANPDRLLRPGQFLHVALQDLQRPSIIVVPKQAVVQTPSSASVYVVNESGDGVEVRMVQLGDWHGNGWIIEAGLSDGELIVVDNVMRLRPGSRVTIDRELELEEFESEAAPPMATQPPSLDGAG